MAKDLLKKMLRRNPEERIKIDEIYEHPWILDNVPNKSLQNARLRLRGAIKKIRTILLAVKLMKKVEWLTVFWICFDYNYLQQM